MYGFDARTGLPLWPPIHLSAFSEGYIAYDGGRLILQGWDEQTERAGKPAWFPEIDG